MSLAPAAISTGGLRNIFFLSSFPLLFVANSQRKRNTKTSYSTYQYLVVFKVERKWFQKGIAKKSLIYFVQGNTNNNNRCCEIVNKSSQSHLRQTLNDWS